MTKIKCLITTGCSFTQEPKPNWPFYLNEHLNVDAYYDGAGSSGNDFISRKTIYRVTKCLEKYSPDEILVGAMWSGVHRKSIYLSNKPDSYTKIPDPCTVKGPHYMNPNGIVDDTENYYLMNSHFLDDLSSTYYKYFHDDIGALIETIENILRVQWFLKLNNIKHFFVEYYWLDSLRGHYYKHYLTHPEVNYLYKQIDFDNFLPVESMGSWIDSETNFKYQGEPGDNHPTPEMSEAFTNRVIVPYLKDKGYID